ncbi:DUF5719 family protein [Microterricola viridarii]|uniref:Large extracellular alpha-helical protein n=1 Tax=Microterricola viridarii TaxID=412690 RepID=A0A109QWJ9_9MICO|nr:DUF5719 family protein [Microterricola viridarii]AMB57859.1 hypothetical protein AWU67_02130 [Microterricola viridarii]
MSTSRRWALAGARVMTGLIGIAAALSTVAAAVLLPWPSQSVQPVETVVTPAAAEQQRVCPGPLLTLAADASAASAASSIGSANTVYAAGSVNALSPDAVAVSPLQIPDNVAGEAAGTPLVLSVPAQEDAASDAPLLAGAQSQTAQTETLTGFAAARCAEAGSDGWLVAGSTSTGQTSLILLSNPTAVVASVDLTVYGENGLVDAPGATGILVQPGSQRVVALAGLAPNLNSPVVHVATRGGQVVASLQQSVIRGLVPGGIDLVGTTAAPDLEQVIAGFIVPAALIDPTRSNESGIHDDGAVVRVLSLGDVPADVTLSVTADADGGNGSSTTVTLEPGVASEIPLGDLTAGSYTVRLNSDAPLVAAARSTEKSAASEDFAWFAASGTLGDHSAIAVADGPAPTLRLANPSTMAQTVTLQQPGAAPVTLSLPAGSALIRPLDAGASYTLEGESLDGVRASVSYQGSAALASFTISPPGPLAQPIGVYVR